MKATMKLPLEALPQPVLAVFVGQTREASPRADKATKHRKEVLRRPLGLEA